MLLLCLKIILPILILIPLVFLSYRFVEIRMEDLASIGDESYYSGVGLYIFASHILLFIANAILTVMGSIGLIISKKYKSCTIQRQNIITFRCLALAPLGSQILYVLVNLIVINIR